MSGTQISRGYTLRSRYGKNTGRGKKRTARKFPGYVSFKNRYFDLTSAYNERSLENGIRVSISPPPHLPVTFSSTTFASLPPVAARTGVQRGAINKARIHTSTDPLQRSTTPLSSPAIFPSSVPRRKQTSTYDSIGRHRDGAIASTRCLTTVRDPSERYSTPRRVMNSIEQLFIQRQRIACTDASSKPTSSANSCNCNLTTFAHG